MLRAPLAAMPLFSLRVALRERSPSCPRVHRMTLRHIKARDLESRDAQHVRLMGFGQKHGLLFGSCSPCAADVAGQDFDMVKVSQTIETVEVDPRWFSFV